MDPEKTLVQTWGIPWEPNRFVEEAVKAGPPMDMATFLPARLQALLDIYGCFEEVLAEASHGAES